MRAVRSIATIALCLCVALVLVVAQGCSKPSTDTGGVAPTKPTVPKGPTTKTAETASAAKAGAAGATTESQPKLALGTTLGNLQAAYNGESNASARYAEFAKKADEEGYKAVAVLFRAASRSEEIHANNHGKAIVKLGGNPTADVKPADVKSTKENLEAAIKGESYEVATMYPGFLEVAKTDKNADAIRSINGALKAEVEHQKLYAEALANLDAWKTVTASIWVCPVCEFTVKDPAPAKCPVCSTDRAKFEEFK